MYEAMAIQGLLSLMGYKSATAEGDKEMIQRFCQDAKQNLEAYLVSQWQKCSSHMKAL